MTIIYHVKNWVLIPSITLTTFSMACIGFEKSYCAGKQYVSISLSLTHREWKVISFNLKVETASFTSGALNKDTLIILRSPLSPTPKYFV